MFSVFLSSYGNTRESLGEVSIKQLDHELEISIA